MATPFISTGNPSCSLKFRCVETPTDLVRVFMVRAIVFMEEQKIPCAAEMDQDDLSCLHVLGEIDCEPVACGRLHFTADTARLQRLAVRRDWRGQGLGTELLRFMLTQCRNRNFHNFDLHAQLQAIKFYARHGFQTVGEPFQEAGIPHVRMILHD